jgi:hypothetical protein
MAAGAALSGDEVFSLVLNLILHQEGKAVLVRGAALSRGDKVVLSR